MKSKVILFSILLFCSKFVDSIPHSEELVRQRAYLPSNRPVSQNIPNKQYLDTDFAQTRDGNTWTNSGPQQENTQDYYANQGRYNYDSYGYNKGPVSSHSGKKLLVNFDPTADGRRLDSYPPRVEPYPSRTFQAGLGNQQHRKQNWRSQNQYANSAQGAAVIPDNERPLVTSVQEPYRSPGQYPHLVPSSNQRYYQTDKLFPTRAQYQYPSGDNSGDTKFIENPASYSGSSDSVPNENYSKDVVIASETKARPTGGRRHVESFVPRSEIIYNGDQPVIASDALANQSDNVKHVENYKSHSDTSQHKSGNRSSEDLGQNIYQQLASGIKTYNLKSIVTNQKIKDLLAAPNKKRYIVIHSNGTVQYLDELDIDSHINTKYHLIHRKRDTFDEADDDTESIYQTKSQVPDRLSPNVNQPTDDNNPKPLLKQPADGKITKHLPPYLNQPADHNKLRPLSQYVNQSENKPVDDDNSKPLPSFENQSEDDYEPEPLPPYEIQQGDTKSKPLPPYVDQPEDNNNSDALPLHKTQPDDKLKPSLPYENKPTDYNNLRPLPQYVNQPENKPVDDGNSQQLPSFENRSEDDNKAETLPPYETQQVGDTNSKPLPPYVDQPKDNNDSDSLPPHKNQPDDNKSKPLPPYENNPADYNNLRPLPQYVNQPENKPADDDDSKQLPSFENQSEDANKPIPLHPYDIQQVNDTKSKPLPPYVDQPEDNNNSDSLPLYKNQPDDNKSKSLPPYENKSTDDSNSKPTALVPKTLDDDQFTSTISLLIASDCNTSTTPQVPSKPSGKEEDQQSTTDSPVIVTTPNSDNTSADEIITISPIELATDNVSDVPGETTTTAGPTISPGELDSTQHVNNTQDDAPNDTSSAPSTDLDKAIDILNQTYSTTTVSASSSTSATDNINDDKIIKEIVKNNDYNQTEDETVVKQIKIGKNDTQTAMYYSLTNTDVPAESDDYSPVTTSHSTHIDVNTGDTSTPGDNSLVQSKTNIIISVSRITANDSEDGTFAISFEVSDRTDDEDSSSDEKTLMVSNNTKNSSEDDSKTSETDDRKKVQTKNDDNRDKLPEIDMANMTGEPTIRIITNNQDFINKSMAKNETEFDLNFFFIIDNQPTVEREKETTIFCNGTVVIETKEIKYAYEDDPTPIIIKTTKIMQIEDYEYEKCLESKN